MIPTEEDWTRILQADGRERRPAAELYREGVDLPQQLVRLVTHEPIGAVLDFGCGIGHLCLGFHQLGCRYAGVDLRDDRISIARKLHGDLPDVEFYWLDASNERYRKMGAERKFARIAFSVGEFDLAVAKSVFTHIGDPREVRHYLRQLALVVRPGGHLWSTWLTSPPLDPASCRYAVMPQSELDYLTGQASFVGWEMVSSEGSGTVGDHKRLLMRRTQE